MSWLKDLLYEKNIKLKGCYKKLKVSQPTFDKLITNPTKMNCLQVEAMAEILGYSPPELYRVILHQRYMSEKGL